MSNSQEFVKGYNKFYSDKEKQRNLSNDKRVKHYCNCDTCKSLMSKNKYERNQGLCDNCIDAIN